jgi:putative nucleotidyltransferase with HDIG domain
VSAATLAMFLSARTFFALSHIGPLSGDGSIVVRYIGPLAIFAAVYFILNTGLVALAVAFSEKQGVWRVWRGHFMPLWPGYIGGISAAGLALFLVSSQSGDFRVVAFVMPIPFILYATFRTAIARMQDQVGHLTRVNSMYLATIESLAQAVDARDQVTHDHIRRVQKNSMRLAHELGIEDDQQLRALEAAALLHDTGKLAIPEHILNKPDKLTAAEFDMIKLHSTIGAEILAPIEFPFPVVPIVRHHHENWDGSGYPDGLRGEEIPIGARIISVVDCYDALTSDRPYRRSLSPDRALKVIVERSGAMYDPAVVAALLRIKDALCESIASSGEPSRVATIAHVNQAIRDESQADPAITILTVNLAGRVGQAVGRHQRLEDLCDDVHAQLSVVMPGLTLVVYKHDEHLDALFGRAASGVHRNVAAGLTIGVGRRLSGWVAAHRTTIINSEAALDLGNVATTLRPSPQLCLSTPMMAGTKLVGVLTVYSTFNRPFVAKDVALFEMLAGLLAPIVAADGQTRGDEPEGTATSEPSILGVGRVTATRI